MYRRVDDFLNTWRSETESTIKIFRQLSDASLGQRVSPEGRTLGFLAWHITVTIPEMLNRAGLAVDGAADGHAPVPSSATAIVAAYEAAARSAADQIRARWTDGTLDETREMYGESWTVGFTLLALITHQAHHRGQMTVLMRQAGLTVPGIYGPAREEWAAYGMAAEP